MADTRAELKSEADIDMIKALHAQIDELELDIQRLTKELENAKKALYRACSDLYSLKYPNNHHDIDSLVEAYLNDQDI